jgi:methylenetetrahydrofolate dehydrogenase (NADP+)/methenyltetrahydrofolate cyclohydrolase
VIIELGKTRTKKGTRILAGDTAENQVVSYIRSHYDLKKYTVQIYLIEHHSVSPRGEASNVSLQKKQRLFEALGIQSTIYIYPPEASLQELERHIVEGNKDTQNAGIIIQMPFPRHLAGINDMIDMVKDLDRLNTHNNIWHRGATAEAALRILQVRHAELGRIAVVGANGFVGKKIVKGIQDNDLGELVPIDWNDDLEAIINCCTIISAVGQPNLIEARYLNSRAHLGIDIGNTKSNGLIKGDFDFDDIDGKIEYLTPVPGGMGPLEMIILAERIVQNTLDPTFHLKFDISSN